MLVFKCNNKLLDSRNKLILKFEIFLFVSRHTELLNLVSIHPFSNDPKLFYIYTKKWSFSSVSLWFLQKVHNADFRIFNLKRDIRYFELLCAVLVFGIEASGVSSCFMRTNIIPYFFSLLQNSLHCWSLRLSSIDVGELSMLLLTYIMKVEKSVHSDKNRGKYEKLFFKVNFS